MNTTRVSSSSCLLTSAAKMAAPMAVAACLALAAGVPASGANTWAPATGDAWTWNFSNAVFQPDGGGSKAAWSNNLPDKAAVFGGVSGGAVSIENIIELNRLSFTTTGYSLRANGGRLQFVLGNPSITIGPDVTTTFDVQIASANELSLTGGGIFQLRSISDGSVTPNVIGDTTAINLGGLTTINLAGRSETVGVFTLTSGTVQNGTLIADEYRLKSGTVDATLGAATVTVTGDILLGGNGNFDKASALVIAGGALDLGANDEEVYRVKLTDGSIAGSGILTGSSFWLEKGEVNTRLSGNGALTKAGDGTVILSRGNTYSGATSIVGGSLVLTTGGSISSASAVTVEYGATLAGSGHAYGPVTVNYGGTLSPGDGAVGTLYTGAQTWNGGGIYGWDIGSLNNTDRSARDLLSIAGGLTINATPDEKFILSVNSLNGVIAQPNGSYAWAIATIGDGLVGTTDLTGRFRIDLPATWTGAITSDQFSVLRVDDTLYLMTVPEPKDYAMILGAITLGLVGYRRWRRTAQFA